MNMTLIDFTRFYFRHLFTFVLDTLISHKCTDFTHIGFTHFFVFKVKVYKADFGKVCKVSGHRFSVHTHETELIFMAEFLTFFLILKWPTDAFESCFCVFLHISARISFHLICSFPSARISTVTSGLSKRCHISRRWAVSKTPICSRTGFIFTSINTAINCALYWKNLTLGTSEVSIFVFGNGINRIIANVSCE